MFVSGDVHEIERAAYGRGVRYRHTQTGSTAILAVGLLAVGIAVIAVAVAGGPVVLPVAIVAVFVVAMLAVFGRLTVTVEPGEVRAAFGWGWPSRTIALSDVVATRSVRNRWYHGWGIRLVEHGWMYNVAGFDAVELDLASGRRFRIGTDQPSELLNAIDSQLASSRRRE